MTVLLPWLLTIQPLTPLAERQKLLAPFFDPPPTQPLEVSDRSLALTRGGDQLLTKGEFWIKPPKNQCLTVRTELQKRDRKICKPTLWTWEIYDLDARGRYHLTVIAGPQDEGTPLVWNTPYRMATYLPVSGQSPADQVEVMSRRCTTSIENEQRKLVLELLDGRRWLIYLPTYDTPVLAKPEPIPNLIVRLDSKKEPITTQEAPIQESGQSDDAAPPKRRSILSQLLSGDYKNVKKETYGFRIPKRNAYEMSSSHFLETSVPQGMNGVCRYSFTGAPEDPSSGQIECYNTDTFDSVYAYVNCFSNFSPRLDPHPKPKPVPVDPEESSK